MCLEVHGDVSTLLPDCTVLTEEDKSSIRSNPVTDKSTDLWKTLSNWVNSILSGELDPALTTFILYRNKSGKKGLAEAFADAKTKDEAQKALDQATKKLKDVNDKHPIWEYFKNTTIDNRDTFLQIIQRFHLDSGEGAGYNEVEQEIVKKHVPTSQIRVLVSSINGWLVRVVSEKISSNVDARITWEEFDKEFKVHFARARRLELIDFTLSAPPTRADVHFHLNTRPIFLQQIELINGTDDDILEAVTDYLRAKTNRDRWIEDDLIDEQLAADLEDKLKKFWLNTQKKIAIKNKSLSKEECGQLLLSECIVRQETLRGEHPPASTIAGTYHALADRPTLGWHADWKEKFKK